MPVSTVLVFFGLGILVLAGLSGLPPVRLLTLSSAEQEVSPNAAINNTKTNERNTFAYKVFLEVISILFLFI
jgi:alcohol dehydrogenase YqhD (iron-dependent ADH family)